VPKEFIQNVYKTLNDNITYYKSHFKFFIEIKNSNGEMNDDTINNAFKAAYNFFTEPIYNPIGKRFLEIAKKTSGRLLPNIHLSIENIRNQLKGWYSFF